MANALSMVVNKLREEVYLVGDAKEEVEKLASTLESIQALLNDADIMQFHNQSILVWFKKLKDVVYDVEDVLDEMIPFPESESGTHDGDDRIMGNQPWACLFSVFSCCGLEDWIRLAHESWTDGDDTDNRSIGDKVQTFVSKVVSQRNFASKIREVRAKLDQIADDKKKFSFKEINSFRGGSELHNASSQTSSLVDESKMFGRDIDKDIIISKLVSGSSFEEGRIRVISIEGVGGLGKTTLARLIYKDERVRSNFNVFLWVCVSDEFDVKTITRKIIEDAREKAEFSDLNPLQNKLLETLQGKRFLLVLDDVWNDNSEKWDELWLSFQSGAPGSKILVTTRSEKVAITCESAYMHKLKGLSDDDCWSLFSSRAFTGRKEEDRLALEKIGREIVNKCKGVPLSVKVIGSVMRSKRTAQDWQDILESETWEIPDIARGILPALLLSYYNLPVHLKQCFAYCSLFPKDHEMEKDRLVKLWLAQGFIKPQGRRGMEAIGEDYFDELVAQSLFQKEEVGCTIHDLLHDLAQFITKNEYCIFEIGKSDSSSVTARHSSFMVNWETSEIPAPLCYAKKLRTLLQIEESNIDTIPANLFECASSLRALDIGAGIRVKELASSIGLLKHLRYLDLSRSQIVELPKSVTHLRNLQTLKLNYCPELARLPRGMDKLVSLRHLEIAGTMKLKCLPEGLGRISSLRTLSRFMVGGNGGCKIGELKRLNSLQGNLVIENLKRVGNGDEAKEAELYKKLHLRVLSLHVLLDPRVEWPGDHEVSGDDEVERMDDVLEALRPPHTNLERLVIGRCIGSKFPTWMEDLPFSNLVDLRLIDCYKCTQLPGLGRLPSLKFLQIEGGLIKRVGHEFYGNSCGGGINRVAFPKLKHLEFCHMNELEEWELRIEDGEIMPSLQKLEVYYCPKLKALPQHLPETLTSLQILECSEISGMNCLPPFLKDFQVFNSSRILSMPLRSLQSLEKFSIDDIENMTLLPDGWEQLKSLEDLCIGNCSKLRSLPDDLGQLKSLRSLQINDCTELRSLPQGLQRLISLEIIGSSEILSRPLPKLPSLKAFSIWNSVNMISLPDGWEQLKSLESLYIYDCSELRSLPDDLGQLKSLRSLTIWYCRELWSLPQGLQGLTHLTIHGSPKLAERCKGEDWSNISHIPNIQID
ncbi:putative disease resistance protein RGA3 [Magnolia sinica]|uniref:putative disease resistance protein RGA3 n=1 Tax=Magnolia sinica TaxID=86752 RepID=UPI002657B15D|nr:putative disease resistance protein RGA3 [Magnolia sinica]XP_058078276.1 putative disease resistance protein RGA3 [Magnolia sinica]XP_058078277.1 putative disease resistance protein RGA3 [Magnolia sinica]XP_058078278.1 putative disease resistance protein RGA3 [Magnolia sinica]XP_058078279.1 putative disease resistance protein RGA3 [Magnolia sinica]XP_058078281.1 putative disease resistance protein RGA3 [Magnolia sinica]XP_058078282.1 putative disease resistance protein RGA3 [Magnolia sinic